jgi:protein O-GlcNAc transferase
MSAGVLTQAVEHHKAGRLKEAEALYREIGQDRPQYADALNLLGVIARQTDRLNEAVDLISRALALNPVSAAFHFNLAEARRGLGRNLDAINSYRASLDLCPHDAEVHHALGLALEAIARASDAVIAYQEAVRLRPTFRRASCDLAACLLRLGRLDEAERVIQDALRQGAEDAGSLRILGEILAAQHRFDESERIFRSALALDGNSAPAWYGLGVSLVRQRKPTEGIRCLEQAIRFKPNSIEAWCQVGAALLSQGRLDAAIAAQRHALALRPDFDPAHGSLLFALNYHPDSISQSILAEAMRWGQRHAHARRPHTESGQREVQSRLHGSRRIRIGYVSPSLRAHTVIAFLEPILANHDHSRFEVFCYSDTRRPDDITARLRRYADVWRETAGLTDEQLEALIRADRIDMLIDLAGHTGDNRLKVFAMRPAPLQLSYLEYPATTGLDAIDYKITDAIADPPGATDDHYTERLLRLPGCAWCYQPFAGAPEPAEPPCVKEGYITFGSFNNYAKVTEPVLCVWSKILMALDGSKLLMLVDTDAEGVECVRKRIESSGIHGDRVEIIRRLPYRSYLQLFNSVDVALDTFPYNGHTTTCDALWMGVPVVTLAGERHICRVGASLLSALGHCEWVARTPDEYPQIALSLAANAANSRHAPAALRHRVAASALIDAPAFTRKFETALKHAFAGAT